MDAGGAAESDLIVVVSFDGEPLIAHGQGPEIEQVARASRCVAAPDGQAWHTADLGAGQQQIIRGVVENRSRGRAVADIETAGPAGEVHVAVADHLAHAGSRVEARVGFDGHVFHQLERAGKTGEVGVALDDQPRVSAGVGVADHDEGAAAGEVGADPGQALLLGVEHVAREKGCGAGNIERGAASVEADNVVLAVDGQGAAVIEIDRRNVEASLRAAVDHERTAAVDVDRRAGGRDACEARASSASRLEAIQPENAAVDIDHAAKRVGIGHGTSDAQSSLASQGEVIGGRRDLAHIVEILQEVACGEVQRAAAGADDDVFVVAFGIVARADDPVLAAILEDDALYCGTHAERELVEAAELLGATDAVVLGSHAFLSVQQGGARSIHNPIACEEWLRVVEKRGAASDESDVTAGPRQRCVDGGQRAWIHGEDARRVGQGRGHSVGTKGEIRVDFQAVGGLIAIQQDQAGTGAENQVLVRCGHGVDVPVQAGGPQPVAGSAVPGDCHGSGRGE